MEHTWMVIIAQNALRESIYHTTTRQDIVLALTVLPDITHQVQAMAGAINAHWGLTKAALVDLIVTFVHPVVTALMKQQHPALRVLQGSTHQFQDPPLVLTVLKDTTHQLQVMAIASHVQLDIGKIILAKQHVIHVKSGNITMLQGRRIVNIVKKGPLAIQKEQHPARNVLYSLTRIKLDNLSVNRVSQHYQRGQHLANQHFFASDSFSIEHSWSSSDLLTWS